MDSRLTQQVALITGASRGIGRATALRLAQAGATTVLAARTVTDLHTVADEIQRGGHETIPIPTDVTNNQQLDTLVQTSVERFGHVDILVNNAGGGTPRTLIAKAHVRDWEWTLRTNLWATMCLTRLVLPHMVQ